MAILENQLRHTPERYIPIACWSATSISCYNPLTIRPVRTIQLQHACISWISLKTESLRHSHRLLTSFFVVISNDNQIISQPRHFWFFLRNLPRQFSIFLFSKAQPCLTQVGGLRVRAAVWVTLHGRGPPGLLTENLALLFKRTGSPRLGTDKQGCKTKTFETKKCLTQQ